MVSTLIKDKDRVPMQGTLETDSRDEGKCAGDIVVKGRFIKTALLKHEWYDDIDDPEACIRQIRANGRKADYFTFIRRLPATEVQYPYHVEWENLAAIRITTFEDWWTRGVPKQTRNHVRRAQKSGLVLRKAVFDDEFVRGIEDIYNETIIRQGKPFWHYKKDFATLKRMHETFLEQSDFIGAYYEGKLIGFVKLVYAGITARTMHIIAKQEHREKAPTNALIAKAVETCAEKGIQFLVYGQYDYGKVGSKSLMVFKKENGFQKIDVPRYYVPLTSLGWVFIKLRLYQGVVRFLPAKFIELLLEIRKRIYIWKYS